MIPAIQAQRVTGHREAALRRASLPGPSWLETILVTQGCFYRSATFLPMKSSACGKFAWSRARMAEMSLERATPVQRIQIEQDVFEVLTSGRVA